MGGCIDSSVFPLNVVEGGRETFIPHRISDASTEYARAVDDLNDAMAQAMMGMGEAFIKVSVSTDGAINSPRSMSQAMDGLSVRHLEVTHSLLDQIGFEYESELEACLYCGTSYTRVNSRGQVECSGCAWVR